MTEILQLRLLARQACGELAEVFETLDVDEIDRLAADLVLARRIACFGVGREGLMMQAGCMRLMHAGLNAHYVGDMATPPVGDGDYLVASAGPGHFPTVAALLQVASGAGASTVVFSANPARAVQLAADRVIFVPAQTAADADGSRSVIPLGGHYEAALLLLFDLLTFAVLSRRGETVAYLRSRYTNLK
jgi:6-phospho-3-hexuloisomerase